MYIMAVFLLALLLAISTAFQLRGIDQETGQKIFHQHKIYIIYVAEYLSEPVIEVFDEYCVKNKRLCATLSASDTNYKSFRNFIGGPKRDHFAILDIKNYAKYIKPVKLGWKQSDIDSFWTSFEQGTLQKYYASQDFDEPVNETHPKLNSKSLDVFLKSNSLIKVVYLYTVEQQCINCLPILQGYFYLIQQVYNEYGYNKDTITFGYIDVFRNNHPQIKNPMVPVFLVFTDESEDPVYGVGGDQYAQIGGLVIKLLMNLQDPSIGGLEQYRIQNTIQKEYDNIMNKRKQSYYQKMQQFNMKISERMKKHQEKHVQIDQDDEDYEIDLSQL